MFGDAGLPEQLHARPPNLAPSESRLQPSCSITLLVFLHDNTSPRLPRLDNSTHLYRTALPR
jgi:hypothetical protein